VKRCSGDESGSVWLGCLLSSLFDNPPPPVVNQPGVVNPEAKEQAETAVRYGA
jgi:hypothetical protein